MSRVSILVPSRTGNVQGLRAQLARQSFRDWELVVQSRTSPAGRARNLGAARAQGSVFIFMDDDIQLPHEELLSDLVSALDAVAVHDAVGVLCAAPATLNRFQRRYLQDAFPPAVLRSGPRPDVVEVSWMAVGAACFGVRRDTFERAGGFDDSLLSGEDYALTYQLHRAGGRIFALRTHRILHEPPRTVGQAIRKTLWYEQGNAQVARKHPESGYRMPLRGPLHAAGYLLARTCLVLPLCVLRISYHHRRPQLSWRPMSAVLSYLGAWAYCYGWFFRPTARMSVHAP